MYKNSVWAPQVAVGTVPTFSRQLFNWMRVLAFLFIFTLPIWPGYAELRVFGLPNLAPTRVLGLSLFFLFFACFFSSPDRQALFLRRISRNWGMFLLLLAFYVFKTISAANASSRVLGIYEFVKLDVLTILPVFFYALFILDGARDLRRVMVLLSCSAFLVACIALVEGVVKKNLFTMLLPIASESMLNASLGGFRDNQYRVQASFEHPLALSEFLSAILPFCIFLFLTTKQLVHRAFYAGTIVLIFAAIYLTHTRSGVGAVAVALAMLALVLIFRWVKSSKNYVAQYLVLLQIPALLCILLLAGYGYRDYFTGKSMEEQRSTYLRVEMFERGLPIVLRNPLTGLGQGRGSDAAGIKISNAKSAKGATTIDNYYLFLAVNAGLPAMLLFLAILGAALLALWRLPRTLLPELKLQGAVLAISLLVFALHATIQSLTSVFPILFLILVMVMVLREEAEQ